MSEKRMDTYVRNGDSLSRVTKILQHILDENRALSNGALFSVLALSKHAGARDGVTYRR